MLLLLTVQSMSEGLKQHDLCLCVGWVTEELLPHEVVSAPGPIATSNWLHNAIGVILRHILLLWCTLRPDGTSNQTLICIYVFIDSLVRTSHVVWYYTCLFHAEIQWVPGFGVDEHGDVFALSCLRCCPGNCCHWRGWFCFSRGVPGVKHSGDFGVRTWVAGFIFNIFSKSKWPLFRIQSLLSSYLLQAFVMEFQQQKSDLQEQVKMNQHHALLIEQQGIAILQLETSIQQQGAVILEQEAAVDRLNLMLNEQDVKLAELSHIVSELANQISLEPHPSECFSSIQLQILNCFLQLMWQHWSAGKVWKQMISARVIHLSSSLLFRSLCCAESDNWGESDFTGDSDGGCGVWCAAAQWSGGRSGGRC